MLASPLLSSKALRSHFPLWQVVLDAPISRLFQAWFQSSSASPSSPHTFFSGQGPSCHRLDSQEPRQQRSATAFGNVCLYEPTGWLEGKNNILRKLGRLIPAGLGEVRSSRSREGTTGTSSPGERAQTGPSSQHTSLLPFAPGLESALGLCSPLPWSRPSLSQSPTPGMTHRVMMELLLPGVPLARPARHATPGGPREAVYIAGTVI